MNSRPGSRYNNKKTFRDVYCVCYYSTTLLCVLFRTAIPTILVLHVESLDQRYVPGECCGQIYTAPCLRYLGYYNISNCLLNKSGSRRRATHGKHDCYLVRWLGPLWNRRTLIKLPSSKPQWLPCFTECLHSHGPWHWLGQLKPRLPGTYAFRPGQTQLFI